MRFTTALSLSAAVVLWLSIGSGRLAAQQPVEAGNQAPVRIGGLSLAPTVQFASGIDTNVFNTPERPKSDLTSTLTPRTTAALRLGPMIMSGRGGADFVYFKESATERSINVDSALKISAAVNRVQPYIAGTFSRTRQRPSFEIDSRSLRRERSVAMGTAFRISGKTEVDVVAMTSTVEFDSGAIYLDTYLRDVLNRKTRTLGLSVREALTPLTTLTMVAQTQEDRFTFASLRNSRSLRITPGFDFASSALISGKASVGYQKFDAIDASVPDFTGVVASVELAYTLLGATRFQVQANRDVDYSLEATAPYYVISGVGLGVTQQVSDSIGITVRGGRYRFTFRSVAPELLDGVSRAPDTLTIEGGGVIYKIGRDLRLNLTADYYHRMSPLSLRGYSGLRAGSTVAYGF